MGSLGLGGNDRHSVMHRQHHLVPLGHTQHLLGHDLPRHSLTDVLHDLPAVDTHWQSLGGVNHFRLAGLCVGDYAQVGILDVQTTWQRQSLAGNGLHQSHVVHIHRLPRGERRERVPRVAPEAGDFEGGAAVRVDNALGFVKRNFNARLVFKEAL